MTASDIGVVAAADDLSQRISGPGANVRLSIVGMDKPFFTAAAIALSLLACFYAYTAGLELQRANYWLQRNEAFLEQLSAQGVRVPPDLLPHKEGRK